MHEGRNCKHLRNSFLFLAGFFDNPTTISDQTITFPVFVIVKTFVDSWI